MKTTRHIQKIICSVLLLSLLLQLIPHNGLLHTASASSSTGNAVMVGSSDDVTLRTDNTVTAEIPETFINQTEDIFPHSITLPELTEEHTRYIHLVLENTFYSELTHADAEFLCEYIGIPSAHFDILEQNGLDIPTSISYAELASAFSCQLAEIIELSPTKTECQCLISQISLYNELILPDVVGTTVDLSLKAKLLQGYTCEQVFNAYGISQVCDVSIDSILSAESDLHSLGLSTESQLQSSGSELSFQSENDSLGGSQITAEVSEEEVQSAISEIIVSPSSSLTTGDTTTDSILYPPNIPSPYSYTYDETEKVSLNTGALIYENVDYTLPGANGLDLVIGRRYNSQAANEYVPAIHYESEGDYIYWVFVVGTAYIGPDGTKDARWPVLDERLEFGPYSTLAEATAVYESYDGNEVLYEDYYTTDSGPVDITIVYSADIVDEAASSEVTGTSGKFYNTFYDSLYGLGLGWEFLFSSLEIIGEAGLLHHSSGSTYEIDWSSTNTSHFKDYTLTDMVLDRNVTEFTSGSTPSYYRLTYQNGTREYFSSDGNLIGICDRYDNTIKFEHSTLNGYPYIVITDTLNRVTTISGSGDSECHIMTVNLPNNIQLLYKVENHSTIAGFPPVSSLSEYTDSAGNKTLYSYTLHSGGFSSLSKSDAPIQNTFACLSTITHPTLAQTVFTYSNYDRNLGENGLMTIYKLTGREDRIGDQILNQIAYSYSSDDYSGWPSYGNPDTIPDSFSYSATITDGRGTVTTAVFNNDHLNTSVTVTDGTNTLRKTLYEYNTDKLPTKITTRQYNAAGMYIETIETAEYDAKGNVTALWSSYANGDTTDTEHKTTYTYDSTYGLPLTQSWKTNATTTVRVQNTLDSAKKNIITTATYVNDVLTRKTDYSYDSYGNVTQQKQYRDNMTDYVLTEYTYQNGAYLTQEKHTGLVTASGSAAASTPGQASGTIVTTHTYDVLGRRLSTTDANGNTTSYTYDTLGNVTSVINPDTTSITHTYNYTANTVTATDENGTVLIYTYTPLGQEYEIVDGQTNGVITRKEYDAYSRLSKITDFVYGGVTEYTYDIFDRITSETSRQGDAVLAQTLYTYDDAAENGLYQKVTKTIVGDTNAPSIITTQYTDKHGNVAKTGRLLDGTEHFDASTYDYVGNVLTQLTAADSQKGLDYTARYVYNEFNQVVTVYNALGQSTTNTYDALGNLIQATDYVGTPTTYTYDNLGRLLTQTFTIDTGVTASTKYEYDPAGNLIREYKPTNAVGESATWARTDYTYDSRGRLITVIQYQGDAVAAVTRYTYDGVGNTLTMTTGLASLEDTEGSTTTYTYDRFGNVLTTTDALGKTETNTYSALGKLNSTTDRKGTVTSYTYDYLGRVLSATTGEDSIQYTYTLTGQVRREQQGQQVTQYTYDALGRTVQVEESPFTYTKAYTYDLADNRTAMTITQGSTTVQAVSYTYDNLNRLSTVSDGGVLRATYIYDTNGNRASLTYGNGVVESYQYNKANWITSLVNSKDDETLSSYAYTYYASGSQKSETDHNSVVTSYVYDDLGRLTQESETGQPTVNYTYSANGNRTQMAVTGTENYIVTYTYDDNNRLITESSNKTGVDVLISYTYDDNGNLLSQLDVNNTAIVTHVYDGFSQLISSVTGNGTITYAYNAQGIRTSRIVGLTTTNYLLDGGNVVGEATGDESTAYLRGANLIYGNGNYYLYNAHGDVVQLADSAGTVTKGYSYDAFGNERELDETDTNPFRYCGEYYDTETGLYYLRARYYDPLIGRFTQKDTFTGNKSDPITLNLYTYCGNEPVGFIDPSGHQRVAGYYTINGVYGWYDDPDAVEFGMDSDTYKIIDELGRRWKDTGDIAERERLHHIAEETRRLAREGTPYLYGNDKVMDTLHSNAAYSEVYWDILGFALPDVVSGAMSYAWFVSMTCSLWNYKYQDSWRVPYETFDGVNMNERMEDGSYPKNWTSWIYFGGSIWSADKIGNINLGYVGTKMGFLDFHKYLIMNRFTMDKDDGPAVQLGIELARGGY